MSFLHPIMLGGLAAVSIPIAIHLLNKFRVRTTDWGAMRFLLDSVRKNEKRVKMEDLILLILRCLLIALAALAFARPALTALAAGGGDSGEPVAAVVILDQSASMSQTAGAETRFDLARKEIRTWLAGQNDQSLAALYLVSNRTTQVIPKPSRDFGLFRKALAEAETTDRGSDLAQGVRLAMESLKTVTGRPREIRIYTDGQATAWAKSEELRELAEANPGIVIKPVLVGGKSEDNRGIVALRADGGVVAARQPCRFHVEVANYGSAPISGLKVSLSIDGGPPAGDAILAEIAPGGTQSAGIVVNFPEAGPRSVEAVISPDGFAADNRRSCAVEVVGQMSVLIAEEDPAAAPMDRDGYFLAHALVPLQRDQVARHYLSAVFVSPADLPAELSNANNTPAQTIFLCNPGSLTEATTRALRDYVRAGGNLVIFPGPRTEPGEWKANAALAEMLPADLGAPNEEGGAALAWPANGFSHPVTALWNDPAQGSLAAVKFQRYFPLTPKPGNSKTIISYANGEASVVEGTFGEGHVVMFGSSARPEWNNLPLHPAFVPLLQRLMGHMNREKESRLTLSPGEVFRKPVAEEFRGKDFSVLRPGSDAARTAGQVTSDGKLSYVRYAGADKAGVYRLASGRDTLATFAVQMDPAESDLRPVDPAVVAAVENVKRDESAGPAERTVVTREFWTPLLWIVAAFFLAEAFMAHRISHAR